VVISVADPGCLSRIQDPDQIFFQPGSRIRTVSISDPGSSSKNLSILTAKRAKKWFLSSKKYDPGCSTRISDPYADFLPSWIPDPGVKKVPNPGSRIRIRNTAGNIDWDADPPHVDTCRLSDRDLYPDPDLHGLGLILVV
jgi:hypothetical protein